MLFRIEIRYTYIGIPAVNDSMMELCPPWDRNQPQAYISPEYLVMRWKEYSERITSRWDEYNTDLVTEYHLLWEPGSH